MADDNQQSENNEPLENNQWEEKEWQAKMDYAKEVLARQQAETDRSKKESEQPEGSEASQKLDSMLDATNKKLDEDEEAEWAEKLAAAKGADRGGGANDDDEQSPKDIQKLLKQVQPIDKKIRGEMKKLGTGYFTAYTILLVVASTTDIIGFICDIVGVAAWFNLFLGPVSGWTIWIILKYTYIGIEDTSLMIKKGQEFFISGVVSSLGIPSRTAMMIREFRMRRELGQKATGEIVKLQGDRQKILGRSLSRQYPPPHLKFKN
jgi:hypothetical protein